MTTLATRTFARCLRRSYATFPTDRAAALALDASIPLKIRQLREAKAKEIARGEHEGEPSLHHSEIVRQRAEKLAEGLAHRGRIRGVRRVKGPDGQIIEKVVGKRIYLPNIIFRLVPNHTKAGLPYNPFEATFRVPQSITKTDVRSYLMAVYGVETTYIRTDNYFLSLRKKKALRGATRPTGLSYKRAIVGLVKPFYYPLMFEDMDGKTRWLEQSKLEDVTAAKEMRRRQKERLLKATQKKSKKWAIWGDDWQTKKQALQSIFQRKEKREQKIRSALYLLDKKKSEENP